MKIVRITLYATLAGMYCWLTWWVLPNIAFVRMAEKGTPFPDSGLIMFGYAQSKVTGHRVIAGIDSGWAALWTGWPCILVGGLVGLGVGYVLGELARKAFAIDAVSEEAVRIAKEYETSASLKLNYCMQQEDQLEKGFNQLSEGTLKLAKMRSEFNQEKEKFENKVDRVESKELHKAKAAIQKLVKKNERLKEKQIDD